MKKIFRLARLALHETSPWYKLFWGFLSICWTSIVLLDDASEIGGAGSVMALFGFNVLMGTMIMCAIGSSDIKLLKVLPLTSGNITDIMAVSAYIGVPIMSVGVSVWHIIFGKAYVIPYIICAFAVSAAFGTATMPLTIRPVGEAGARKFTFWEIVLVIVCLAVPAAIGTILCLRGYKNGCIPTGDIPMLIAVFIGCIALSLIVTAVYRKKVRYWSAG